MMHKIWNYVIDIFIAVTIMFFAVMIYFGLRTETVVKSMTNNITENFITAVKENGSFTLSDYERFMEKLSLTNTLFDIEFEHKYKVLEPEYRFRTLEEIISAQNASYSGPNDYHYREVVTEKPEVSDPVNTGNLNTETNESVLAKAVDTPAAPGHVHSEGCYAGHRHLGSPYFIHTHQHTYSCVEYTGIIFHEYQCNTCKIFNKRFLASYYWDTTTNSVKLGMSNGGTASCMSCGSTNLINSVTRYGYDYSCGYNIDIDKDGYNDAVGRGQAYQYTRSYPQDTLVRQTVNNGCYKYHQHVNFPVAGYNYYGYPYYTQDSLYQAASKGWYAYCSMPEYYTILWQYSTGAGQFRITYRVVVDSKGTINFVFGSAYATYYSNPRIEFPQTMTLSEFAGLANVWTAEDFWERHYGIEFNDFRNDYSGSISCSGDISRCSETIHNKWYNTCGYEESNTLACDKIISTLAPTHPTQTVYTNGALITTAVATYMNGSKKTIVCTTSFSTAYVVANQPVTLTYTYSIDGVSYSKSCTITASVIRRNKTCSNGHTYNLNNDGSDPGCPFCRVWVRDLRITYPATSTFTITIGTTLVDNGLTILVTYLDGHMETITSGFVDNLDSGYLGTKLVTIGYKGVTTSLMVTTIRAKITCDICGFIYDLYPDGTNPGCPRCISKTPVFAENILDYEVTDYTEHILETLYTNGKYPMNKNDVFAISIKNKSSNLARNILGKVFPSLTEQWVLLQKSEKILASRGASKDYRIE